MTCRYKDIRGKVVAITGGARGIGKATGEAFLRAGARVALGDIDIELVEKAAVELAEVTGGDVCGLPLDVTNRQAFASFLESAEARLGPLDVLVNNAGIMPTGLFVDEADAMTDRMLDINLSGVRRTTAESRLPRHHPNSLCGRASQVNSGGSAVG